MLLVCVRTILTSRLKLELLWMTDLEIIIWGIRCRVSSHRSHRSNVNYAGRRISQILRVGLKCLFWLKSEKWRDSSSRLAANDVNSSVGFWLNPAEKGHRTAQRGCRRWDQISRENKNARFEFVCLKFSCFDPSGGEPSLNQDKKILTGKQICCLPFEWGTKKVL